MVSCCSFCQITRVHVFSSVLRCMLRFPGKKNDDRFVLFPSPSPHLLSYRGFMFNIYYLYLFIYIGVKHDFHSRWRSCRLTVARWVSHVEQKLITLLGHMRGVHVARSFVFRVVFRRSLFVPLVLFFLLGHCNVCMSSTSDYPLWHFVAIVMFVCRRLLITPLVSCSHCNVCMLSTSDYPPLVSCDHSNVCMSSTSDYPFGILWPL
jgi:hypothetical protein